MVKVWRNRIWAGTQKLVSCPPKYKNDVIAMMQEDLLDGTHTINDLKALVESGMLSEKEYKEISGEEYTE